MRAIIGPEKPWMGTNGWSQLFGNAGLPGAWRWRKPKTVRKGFRLMNGQGSPDDLYCPVEQRSAMNGIFYNAFLVALCAGIIVMPAASAVALLAFLCG